MWRYELTNDGNDYLVHHGILGMKWGVRRYQNKDGTLTSSGQKRYSDFRATPTKKAFVPKVSATDVKKKLQDVVNLGAKVYGKFQEAKIVDEIFYGGNGSKIAISIGRTATEAVLRKMGHTNIKWY